MVRTSILDRIAQYGIVPVVTLDKPEMAVPLADALAEGGLPLVEIAFRTNMAAEAIRRIRKERPTIIVGAGTLLTTASLKAARSSGAAFGVAPGLNPLIVKNAKKMKLPFIPGVATSTEIEKALGLGCKFLKFFPAQMLGGVEMLEALSLPFRHTGLRFLATGGVTTTNLGNYLELDTVAAAGGTWIAHKEDIESGKWDDIRDRCKAALELVERIRSG